MNNVRFVMAGSSDMMNKMIRHAAQLRITDKFTTAHRSLYLSECGTSETFTQLAGAVIDNIYALFTSMW